MRFQKAPIATLAFRLKWVFLNSSYEAASAACLRVSRIQPDNVFCLLCFIALANSFNSASVKRTGTIRPLTSPFANLGRPRFFAGVFLVVFIALPVVLKDRGSNG